MGCFVLDGVKATYNTREILRCLAHKINKKKKRFKKNMPNEWLCIPRFFNHYHNSRLGNKREVFDSGMWGHKQIRFTQRQRDCICPSTVIQL